MAKPCDILIYAEDPNITNYMMDIPSRLAQDGMSAHILCNKSACSLIEAGHPHASMLHDGDQAYNVLKAFQPRALLCGTAADPDSIGLRLIDACKDSNIPTFGAIDAAMHVEKRFSGHSTNPLQHAPDFLCVTDQWLAEQFQNIGVDSTRIFQVGHPQYDKILTQKALFAKKGRAHYRAEFFPDAPDDAIITIFISERFNPVKENWLGEPKKLQNGSGQSFEAFITTIKSIIPNSYNILRLHPKDDPSLYVCYAEDADIIHYGGRNVLEMIYGADLIVGNTSMLLSEAALLGKHTLSIIPHEEEKNWLTTVRNGIVEPVQSYQDLKRVLKYYAQNVDFKLEKDVQAAFILNAPTRITNILKRELYGS